VADDRILLGVIGRPHGVRGLVHVQSYTADPADLAGYGPLSDESGRTWTLSWRSDGVAQLMDAAGGKLADRDAAQALTNVKLFIERDRLPPPDDEEFYLADLVGLQAVTPDGAMLGRVLTVHDYGAGTSLEITGPNPVIVPFTKACVPEIDMAARRVVIVPPHEVVVAPDAVDIVAPDAVDNVAPDLAQTDSVHDPAGATA